MTCHCVTNPVAKLLITGGAGFIGSHTAVVLLEAGHELVVFDDFSNSNPRDLEQAFTNTPSGVDAVIHFAGLKSVGESVEKPLHYWDVNLNGSRCLLRPWMPMAAARCSAAVQRSTATQMPFLSQRQHQALRSLHSHTKAAVEQMLNDLHASAPDSGGSLACVTSTQLAPIRLAALGKPTGHPQQPLPLCESGGRWPRAQLQVFGGDWPTPDGTGARDYIHVMDRAEAAMYPGLPTSRSAKTANPQPRQRRRKSVLEVVEAMETQ